MKTAFRATLFVCFGILATVVFADSWAFPREVIKKTHEFGVSKIILEQDGTQNFGHPDYTLTIYLEGKLMAKYKNVAFQDIFASSDNKYFAGLSNDGIPGTAFVIFDNHGNLLREEKHRFMDYKMYSLQSVTRVRRWYDKEKPEVEFVTHHGYLDKVLVNSSKTGKYNLMGRQLKAE